MIHDFVSISSIFMKDHKANNAENVFKNNQSKILNVFISWRTMEPPLRHIHSRSLPLESDDRLPNVSSCIQDTTYFAVVLADDSGGKSCHLFVILLLKGGSIYKTFLVFNYNARGCLLLPLR